MTIVLTALPGKPTPCSVTPCLFGDTEKWINDVIVEKLVTLRENPFNGHRGVRLWYARKSNPMDRCADVFYRVCDEHMEWLEHATIHEDPLP